MARDRSRRVYLDLQPCLARLVPRRAWGDRRRARPDRRRGRRSPSGSVTRSASSTPSASAADLRSASDRPTPPSRHWSGRWTSAAGGARHLVPMSARRHWARAYALSRRTQRASCSSRKELEQAQATRFMFGQALARGVGWPRCTRTPAAWQRRTTKLGERCARAAREHGERGHEAWALVSIGAMAAHRDPLMEQPRLRTGQALRPGRPSSACAPSSPTATSASASSTGGPASGAKAQEHLGHRDGDVPRDGNDASGWRRWRRTLR